MESSLKEEWLDGDDDSFVGKSTVKESPKKEWADGEDSFVEKSNVKESVDYKDNMKEEWLDGEDETFKESEDWHFDDDDNDLSGKQTAKEWDLLESDVDFSRNMAQKGGIRDLVEKWDTADDDLLKIGGEKKGLIEKWDEDNKKKRDRKEDILDGWKSGKIANLKIKPMSFTEPYNFKKEWRDLSRSNVVDDLQAMADLQWKIISTLKKVERKSKENNCNLRDLTQRRAAVSDLKETLDLDIQEPAFLDTEHFRGYDLAYLSVDIILRVTPF